MLEIILKAESEEKIGEILKEHGIHMKTDELKAFYQDVKNVAAFLRLMFLKKNSPPSTADRKIETGSCRDVPQR